MCAREWVCVSKSQGKYTILIGLRGYSWGEGWLSVHYLFVKIRTAYWPLLSSCSICWEVHYHVHNVLCIPCVGEGQRKCLSVAPDRQSVTVEPLIHSPLQRSTLSSPKPQGLRRNHQSPQTLGAVCVRIIGLFHGLTLLTRLSFYPHSEGITFCLPKFWMVNVF